MSGERYSRQSFLGEMAEQTFAHTRVGIVGLGGGGSHIAQQLAYLGFQHFVLYDPDRIETSNMNRLIGGTEADVRVQQQKILIAGRLIRSVQPQAEFEAIPSRWQEDPMPLQRCDLVFGCVDGLNERRELEVCSRRFLLPYIDVGLGVRHIKPNPPVMAGQIVLSMPGHACLTCMGFLNEKELAEEAARYGDAGDRPQVVWANGILASLAVGVAIDLLTGWTQGLHIPTYLIFDANTGQVQSSVRLEYLPPGGCLHFPPNQVGDLEW